MKSQKNTFEKKDRLREKNYLTPYYMYFTYLELTIRTT